MKKFLPFIGLLLPFLSFATIHQIEAGGSQVITPYYSPQFITIEVGDTVLWTFVSGEHNVTSTSAPESISSGDISSPNTFQYVFTIEGLYDYECTLWDHADTQFGTITVVASTNSVYEVEETTIDIYPMPAKDIIYFSANNISEFDKVTLFNIKGEKVLEKSDTDFLNISRLTTGVYFIALQSSKGITRRKIVIK